MLDVLDAAQSAGQRAQQDAQMGQGSIFDLFDAGGGADTTSAAPSHPPVPTHEFERNELLTMERESIGIFISEHPLKRVSAAMQLKADCTISELSGTRDGEWRKVGGMITEHKKIRTRSGKMMMFATIADLEGSVEVVIFDEVMQSIEELIATDSTMLIKGKVEQKEQGKVSLVASSVEEFDPSDAEIEKAREKMAKVAATAPKALKRRVDAAQLPATVIEDLRDLFERYPGETEFVLEMHTRTGLRRLKFGAGFRVQARDAGLRAELDDILGAAASAAA